MGQALLSALLELPSTLAGHGYDTGSAPRGDSGGADGGGGISSVSIIIVLVLALVTIGLLVGVGPSGGGAKLKAVAPKALIALVLAGPLVLWTAFPGASDSRLIVERATGVTGAPELLVSLADDGANTLEATDGQRAVRVECVGRDGETVIDAYHGWPFVDEAGYDLPHAHQPANADQLRRVDVCRLRGTRDRLEAEVGGRLAP